MSLPVPVVGEDPGEDWATNIDACLGAIDSHNHSSGQGVQITPNGLNINTDLPINDNNITTVRSVRFSSQVSPINGVADLGCLYESGVDLYYNDGAGNQIRVTQSGSVSGSAGTITGLPSGTASAAYAGGAFTFQAATNTPAALNVGPTTIAQAVANGKGVTISPSVSQAANYNLTLPVALPISTSFINLDASGNMGTVATTGTGTAVLATSPTIITPTISSGTIATPTISTPVFTGVPTGTITSGAFSPTSTWTYVSGGTVTITITSATHYYYRIGNIVTAVGVIASSFGVPSGSFVYNLIIAIPLATTSLVPVGATASGNTAIIAGTLATSSGPGTFSVTYRYTYIIN